MWFEGNCQSCPSTSGEGWGTKDWVQAPRANDLICHAYTVKPPYRPKRQGVEDFQAGEHGEVLGDWQALERAWKLWAPAHVPCPVHLFHQAVPELYLFIINQWSRKWMFFWVCELFYQINLTSGGGCWDPLSFAGRSEAQVTTGLAIGLAIGVWSVGGGLL